ncbi:MAG: SIMPL domain-containing protein [Pseudomonadota bacterium]
MIRLLVALVLTAGLHTPAVAEPVITLVGTGSVVAVPDKAYVTVAIETVADSARDAQASNSAAGGQTILALREAGVRAQDLRTETFAITPVYAPRSSGSDEALRISGYRVVNRIEATVYNIVALGDLLDAVVESGANRIEGLRFAVSNEDELLDEARRRAVTEATRRAQLYAEAMGVVLGPVQSLREGTGGHPGPSQMAQTRMATPVMPGMLDISATVTMSWAIFDR